MNNYSRNFSLEGKTALVTGACGLLGSEITFALASMGAKVIMADVDKKRASTILKQLAKPGLKVDFEYFDITRTRNLKQKIKEIFKKYGKITTLINSAYPRTEDWHHKCEDVSALSWQKNVDRHMNAYCLLSKETAELMKQHQIKGSIINLGSIYGFLGPDFSLYQDLPLTMPAAYAAIKGGITNFSRYLAAYYGAFGIRCNVISPGGVFNEHNKIFVKRYVEKTALKRMASVSDVAGGVIFLSADASSYITGTNLIIDGGWSNQ